MSNYDPHRPARPTWSDWLRVAASRRVAVRALGYAAIVGPILILINHGDAILAGDVGLVRLGKMGLTVLVPYLVSTCSSVGALSEP